MRRTLLNRMASAGSHHQSIRMVADKTIDGATIDSNALVAYLAAGGQDADRIRVLCSWGPMPIQPLVVRSALPGKEVLETHRFTQTLWQR